MNGFGFPRRNQNKESFRLKARYPEIQRGARLCNFVAFSNICAAQPKHKANIGNFLQIFTQIQLTFPLNEW